MFKSDIQSFTSSFLLIFQFSHEDGNEFGVHFHDVLPKGHHLSSHLSSRSDRVVDVGDGILFGSYFSDLREINSFWLNRVDDPQEVLTV